MATPRTTVKKAISEMSIGELREIQVMLGQSSLGLQYAFIADAGAREISFIRFDKGKPVVLEDN